MTTNRHFCEVTFDERARARRQPRRRAEQQLSAADAPDGTRARRHRSSGLELRAAIATCSRHPRLDRSDPIVRQELAAIETGYRIGRLLVLRETLRQAPAGFSAATKTFGTEFEQRVAAFCARVLGPHALLWGEDNGLGGRAARRAVLRARVHDHGRHHPDPAQHPRRAGPRTPPLRAGGPAAPARGATARPGSNIDHQTAPRP